MKKRFGLENSLVYKTVTQGIISPHFDTSDGVNNASYSTQWMQQCIVAITS